MEPAVVRYTLGAATGLEADVYTHRTITLHAYSISRPDDWSIGRSDTILPAVPVFHEHGWGLPYAAVMCGSRLILPGPHLQPERMLDLLSAHRVTLTGAALTLWLDVLDALEREPHRWALTPGTRIVVGGATAPASMVQRFDAHRVRVIQPRAMELPIATNSIPELEENISSSSVNAI
jgi:fatty-acyl-CoA synthase